MFGYSLLGIAWAAMYVLRVRYIYKDIALRIYFSEYNASVSNILDCRCR